MVDWYSEHGEVRAQLLQELVRVVVVGEGGEGLLRELVRVLEVAELEGEQGAVEARLEHVRGEAVGRAEVGTGRVDVALTQLEHPEVAVGLRVVGVLRDRNLKGLRAARWVIPCAAISSAANLGPMPETRCSSLRATACGSAFSRSRRSSVPVVRSSSILAAIFSPTPLMSLRAVLPSLICFG